MSIYCLQHRITVRVCRGQDEQQGKGAGWQWPSQRFIEKEETYWRFQLPAWEARGALSAQMAVTLTWENTLREYRKKISLRTVKNRKQDGVVYFKFYGMKHRGDYTTVGTQKLRKFWTCKSGEVTDSTRQRKFEGEWKVSGIYSEYYSTYARNSVTESEGRLLNNI